MFLNIKITLAIVAALSVPAVSASEIAAADTMKTEKNKAKEAYAEYSGFDKFRFGGYGEMLVNFLDYGPNRWTGTNGAPKEKRGEISIPRFVVAFDYKFTSKWILGVEVEFEAGGTGTAVEIENSENGEYETEIEWGGEVALEQFHITRLIIPEINVRVGHIIVPVGLTNFNHEPINFFGTRRPEGEATILPSTWHETGLELFGTVGRKWSRFSYQAMVVGGLNPNGFDRDTWVASGKQGLFEVDNFSCPATVFRLNYEGVPGLRVGGSIYWCPNVVKNSDEPQTYSSLGKVPVTIYTADAQYKNRYVTARFNMVYGNLADSYQLSRINTRLSNKSPYSRLTPIAKNAVSYAGEVGFNLASLCPNLKKFPVIYPFARYEYYNPQEKGEPNQVMELRDKVSMWTVGLNYYPLPNLVVKFDYTTRQIGTSAMFGKSGKFNSENEFGLGIAYVGWFVKK